MLGFKDVGPMWKAWLFRSWYISIYLYLFYIRLRYFDPPCVVRMPPFWLTAADSHDGFAEQRQLSANCASAERLHNLQNPRHTDAAAMNGQRIILYHSVIC